MEDQFALFDSDLSLTTSVDVDLPSDIASFCPVPPSAHHLTHWFRIGSRQAQEQLDKRLRYLSPQCVHFFLSLSRFALFVLSLLIYHIIISISLVCVVLSVAFEVSAILRNENHCRSSLLLLLLLPSPSSRSVTFSILFL